MVFRATVKSAVVVIRNYVMSKIGSGWFGRWWNIGGGIPKPGVHETRCTMQLLQGSCPNPFTVGYAGNVSHWMVIIEITQSR